jgi:hypothetical protein
MQSHQVAHDFERMLAFFSIFFSFSNSLNEGCSHDAIGS